MKQIRPDYTNVAKLTEKLGKNSEAYWNRKGSKKAIDLFHQMSQRVPAYKDFLKKNKVKPELVRTVHEFSQVPTVSKDTYLRQYPLDSMCWDGDLGNSQSVIASTSGSTGVPFYFPRQNSQDLQYAALAEIYLQQNFQVDKKSTLYIIGFPMGQWIGGVFTYEALSIIAKRTKWPLSIITPGVNSVEIINAIKTLGPYYEQIIIGSYGPFLKDTLDEAVAQGIDLKQYNLGFVFAAEVFSESFRDYVKHESGLSNELLLTLNQYGTVDLGTMAYETPLSILSRKVALKKRLIFKELFNEAHRIPTLTQYLPEMFYFESVDENLICSAQSGLPLVRYDLKDRGRVVQYSELLQIFTDHNTDIIELSKEAGIEDTIWKLPFVYVYERADFSVSYYAFLIYPETIRRALLSRDAQKVCSGKFAMTVKYDRSHRQKLTINVEEKMNVHPSSNDLSKITAIVHTHLLNENSEYRKTFEEKGRKVKPKIKFWPHRNSRYFNPLIKQRWVI